MEKEGREKRIKMMEGVEDELDRNGEDGRRRKEG